MNFRRAQLFLFTGILLIAALLYIVLHDIIMGPIAKWFLQLTSNIGLTLNPPTSEGLIFFIFFGIIYFAVIKFLSPNLDAVDSIERFFSRKEKATEPRWDVSSPQNVQVRRDLIANMRLSWIDEKSLHETIHIELGLAYDATKLDRPMQLWEGQPDRRGIVPVGKPIRDVFAECGRSLLILGDPGSGKTYTLVQLARQLLENVTPENIEPIPIILNLSSWAAKKPEFTEWLVEQLVQQYGIGKKVTPALLQASQLCLLLDGLDEVEEDARHTCVETINRFRGDTFMPLVVCSRINDYQRLTSQLQLTNAVVIQPLSDGQIVGYLTDRRLQLDTVYEAVKQDDALKELARTPLFLSIMAVAYKGHSLADLRPLLDDVEQRQCHLYQTYIRRTLSRPRDNATHYTTHQSLSRLAYLSQQLSSRDNYHFYFENLQQDWLPSAAANRHRLISSLSVVLIFGSVFGIVFTLIVGLLLGLIILPAIGLTSGLAFGILIGLGGGLMAWRLEKVSGDIEPVEELTLVRPTKSNLKNALAYGLIRGLIRGLSTGLIVWIVAGLVIGIIFGMDGGLVRGLIFGLAGGLGVGLVVGLVIWLGVGLGGGLYSLVLNVLKPLPSRIRVYPGQGIDRSGRNALVGGIVVGLIFGLIGGLVYGTVIGLIFGQIDGLITGFVVGLVFGLIVWLGGGLVFGLIAGLLAYGGIAYFRHYLLRWQLQRVSLLPFRLQPFLDAMAGRIILQQNGPSYRFIHRTLQEHFASLTQEDIELLAHEIETGPSH